MTKTAPVELVTVPCLKDNYAYLIHNAETGETVLVDAPEAGPIRAVLDQRGWTLTDILITHHHYDHIDAVDELRGDARVVGAVADAKRLPALDLAVKEGDLIRAAGQDVHVFDVSGHTIGHIAFYIPAAGLVFTADSLMALGCGRLFEGTPEIMWDSMQKLRALPDETLVCSGHEYTASNARFALSIDPENDALILRARGIEAARAAGQPTVPSTLAEEKRTNPFLRADLPELKAAIGMSGASDVDVFAEVRARKDRF